MSLLSQTQPYIPDRQAEFDRWFGNFSSRLTADPSRYAQSAPTAVAVQAAFDSWHAAFLLATAPPTRTSGTVAAKDAERAASLAVVRPVAQNIVLSAAVGNDDKLALGLTVRDATPTPIPPPATSPILSVIAATPFEHTIRYADQNTPDRRAKPFGAVGLELWRFVGTAPATDPSQARYIGTFTRQPIFTSLEGETPGLFATYFGRWVARRDGAVGPWSTAVSMVIVGSA